MPVPRLFETPSDQHERWSHVLACLIALTGPETRPALVSELVGEDLPGVEEAQTREAVTVDGTLVDIVIRDRGKRWIVAVQTTLGYDVDTRARLESALTALAGQAERVIGLLVAPDRKPNNAVAAASANGHDVRHKSWLRVRDWVQERPERGGSTGVDQALLREAEYFFTPRVAELYRLEELMATVSADLRETLSALYFDFNDLSIAPLMTNPATGVEETTIVFPRTGEPGVRVTVDRGVITVGVAQDGLGGGFTADGGWSRLAVGDASAWAANRSEALGAARIALPAAR